MIITSGAPIDDDDTDSFHGIQTGQRIQFGTVAPPKSILKKGVATDSAASQSPPE